MDEKLVMPTKTEVWEMLSSLPDEDCKDQFYSKINQAHLEKSIKELKDGKGTPHELKEDF